MSLLIQLRRNKYDEEEVEYWVDARTIGTRGTSEKEGMRDVTNAQGAVNGFGSAHQPSNLDEFDPASMGGCSLETGKDKAPILSRLVSTCMHLL